MKKIKHLINVFVIVFLCYFIIITSHKVKDEEDAIEFLQRYGYLKDNGNALNMVDEKAAIKEFQHMGGLKETGNLDKNTIKLMNSPRCGNKDKGRDLNPSERIKRYKINQNRDKWSKSEITYKILKYSEKLSKDEIDTEIGRAFKLWENETPLYFIKKSSLPVDIEISFSTGKHCVGKPFDVYTAGHAFYPNSFDKIGGDVHFNDAFQWTFNSTFGDNLLTTAIHEIGHAIGIGHSDVKGSLMWPYTQDYNPNVKLHNDDIKAAQDLYGPKHSSTTKQTISTTTPTTIFTETTTELSWIDWFKYYFTKKPKVKNENDLCDNPKIDAITMMTNTMIYVFHGSQVYALSSLKNRHILVGNISTVFNDKSLPSNIDAAFSKMNGETFIFKGDKVWRFIQGIPLFFNNPKLIEKQFKGIPNDIDAAFVHPITDYIYFTKGTNYWRYDQKIGKVDASYPRSLTDFGIKGNINAAFINFLTLEKYFFKGFNVWTASREKKVVESRFEKSAEWFGCKEKPNKRNSDFDNFNQYDK